MQGDKTWSGFGVVSISRNGAVPFGREDFGVGIRQQAQLVALLQQHAEAVATSSRAARLKRIPGSEAGFPGLDGKKTTEQR